MRSRPWLYGIFLSVAVFCLVAVSLTQVFRDGLASEGQQGDSSQARTESFGSQEALAGQAGSRSRARSHQTTAVLKKAVLTQAEATTLQNRQYDALRFGEPGFTAESLAIVAQGDCAPDVTSAVSFAQLVGDRLASPVDELPLADGDGLSESRHLGEAALFFESEGRFVQILATQRRGRPAVYRIEAYSFADARFERQPEAYSHPSFSSLSLYDARTLRDIFSELKADFPDARLYQRLGYFNGAERVSVRFFGSLPVTLERPGEHCAIDTDERVALCQCAFSSVKTRNKETDPIE